MTKKKPQEQRVYTQAPGGDRLTKPLLLAAVVVGGSILAGSWMLRSSIDETSAQLDEITAGLTATKSALEEVAKSRPASAAPARKGVNPKMRYTFAFNDHPAKGPSTAKVKIYEFSDFQ